jgi:Predicted pyrophosphatase
MKIDNDHAITITEWVILCGTLAQAKGFNLTAIDQQMMLIVSEVSEAHDVYRNRTGLAGHYEEAISEELADIVIRVFSFCFGNGIDLESAIIRKHAINAGRPIRHGKDF